MKSIDWEKNNVENPHTRKTNQRKSNNNNKNDINLRAIKKNSFNYKN